MKVVSAHLQFQRSNEVNNHEKENYFNHTVIDIDDIGFSCNRYWSFHR